MQQQKEMSPIWAIDLFERRKFRNGNAEAQCMECGQSFDPSEEDEMTRHIVQKHVEFAAKLLAKQLEFGNHQHLKQQQEKTMPKMELAKPSFATGSANNNHNDSTEKGDGENGILGDDFGHNATTSAPLSTVSPSSPDSPILNSDANNASICHSPCDNENFRVPSPATPPLFSPEHSAAFVAGEESRDNWSMTIMDITATTPVEQGRQRRQSNRCQDSGSTRWHSNGDIVAAFSAALPEIENSKWDTSSPAADHKGHIELIDGDNKTNVVPPPLPYRDWFGKQWHWLFNLDNIEGHSERIRHFCQTYFVIKVSVYPTRAHFACKLARRKPYCKTAVRCPYRALYVAHRRAMFAFNSHNHPPLEEEGNDTAANEATGEFQRRCHPKQQPQQQEEDEERTEQNNTNCTAVTIGSNGNDDASFDSKNLNKNVLQNVVEDYADYSDRVGIPWKFLAKIDLGQCETYTQRQQMCQFCHEHGLSRQAMRRHSDGTLRVYALSCNKWCTPIKCPYRAIYVVQRRAIFERYLHNHPTLNPPKKIGIANEAIPFTNQSQQQQHIGTEDTKENAAVGGFADQMDVNYANDHYVDKTGKLWKWMAKIDIGKCETYAERKLIRQFCLKHSLHRQNNFRHADGTLRVYSMVCKRKHRNKCLFRAVYVAERRAIFMHGCHNHKLMKQLPKTKAEMAIKWAKKRVALGMAKDSDSTSDSTINEANCSFSAPPTTISAGLQQSTDENKNKNGNFTAAVTIGIKKTKENDSPQRDVSPYMNRFGKLFKWLTHFDVGQGQTYGARQRIRGFCRERGLHRSDMLWESDGTLRALRFICKQCRKANKQRRFAPCPYRAIYVVQRSAIFERGFHDHTKPAPKKQKRPLDRRKVDKSETAPFDMTNAVTSAEGAALKRRLKFPGLKWLGNFNAALNLPHTTYFYVFYRFLRR